MNDVALRMILFTIGACASVWIVQRMLRARVEGEEGWSVRIAAFVVLPLAVVYGARHALLLLQSASIEALAAPYARYGDPRAGHEARSSLSGWLLDCTGDDAHAWVGYESDEGTIRRVVLAAYVGASLVADPEDRLDYTVERLFAPLLERPRSLRERLESHPVGTDVRLTLCRRLSERADQLLSSSGRMGAVILGDVSTGAIVAYAASQSIGMAPIGVKQYMPPGSVNKLMLAGLWWDEGWSDMVVDCPATVDAGGRSISNYRGQSLGSLIAPKDVLVYSCNTATVTMAAQLRNRLGEVRFQELYRKAGFSVYTGERHERDDRDFWATQSDGWRARMSPPTAQVRLGEGSTLHEWGQVAIGQGPIDVTVLHVVRLVQAIGNDGVMLKPTVEWSQAEDPTEVDRIFRRGTTRRLRDAMKDVVQRGTARSAQDHLGEIGEWSLIGKTGTAQVPGRRDDGWFAGLIVDPDDRPRYTVAVYLREGGPGGSWPARIAAELVSDAIALARTP